MAARVAAAGTEDDEAIARLLFQQEEAALRCYDWAMDSEDSGEEGRSKRRKRKSSSSRRAAGKRSRAGKADAAAAGDPAGAGSAPALTDAAVQLPAASEDKPTVLKAKKAKQSQQQQPAAQQQQQDGSAAPKEAAPGRPWTSEEEALFQAGLEVHGRDWQKLAAHVATRDARQVSSHAQKYFVKLCVAGKRGSLGAPACAPQPLPARVAASGEGYTLSGKPLDPCSASAIAYGFKPALLAKLDEAGLAQAKRGLVVPKLPRSLGGENDELATAPPPVRAVTSLEEEVRVAAMRAATEFAHRKMPRHRVQSSRQPRGSAKSKATLPMPQQQEQQQQALPQAAGPPAADPATGGAAAPPPPDACDAGPSAATCSPAAAAAPAPADGAASRAGRALTRLVLPTAPLGALGSTLVVAAPPSGPGGAEAPPAPPGSDEPAAGPGGADCSSAGAADAAGGGGQAGDGGGAAAGAQLAAERQTEYARQRPRREGAGGRLAGGSLLASTSESTALLRPCSFVGQPGSGAPLAQPFAMRMHAHALVVMDFHAHLSGNEVIGLLGGAFDPATRTLTVRAAYPCRRAPGSSARTSVEMDPCAQVDALAAMEAQHHQCVGWYHSHPVFEPLPSQKDLENNFQQQQLYRDTSSKVDAFVGVIMGPHDPCLPSPLATSTVFTAWRRPPSSAPQAFSVRYALEGAHLLPPAAVTDVLRRLLDEHRDDADRWDFAQAWRGRGGVSLGGVAKLQTSLAQYLCLVKDVAGLHGWLDEVARELALRWGSGASGGGGGGTAAAAAAALADEAREEGQQQAGQGSAPQPAPPQVGL